MIRRNTYEEILIKSKILSNAVLQHMVSMELESPITENDMFSAVRHVNGVIDGDIYDPVIREVLKSFETETGIKLKDISITLLSGNGSALMRW